MCFIINIIMVIGRTQIEKTEHRSESACKVGILGALSKKRANNEENTN